MNPKDSLFMPEDHMDKLYNSPNPLVRFIHNIRLKYIVNSIPDMAGLKILDAGCGEGHLLERIYHCKNKNHSYFGADITDIALEKARKRCLFAKISKMDLRALDFDSNFFDVVICSEVLEHIRDYENVIEELKRVLKANGVLIISFPNEVLWTMFRFFLLRRPIKVADHVNSFRPALLSDKIALKFLKCQRIPFNVPVFASLSYIMVFRK